MLTQRDNDIAVLEAKLKAEKLFQEWRKSYLGKRAEYVGTGNGRGAAEDRTTANADNYAPEIQ